MVKIRLSRVGRLKKPLFNIVALDSRLPRNGRFLEKMGQYTPKSEPVFKDLNTEAISNWIAKGAQCSPSLISLFKRYNVEIKNL